MKSDEAAGAHMPIDARGTWAATARVHGRRRDRAIVAWGVAMLRRGSVWLLAFVTMVMLVEAAGAQDKRIALLIGNEAYASEIGRLANPHNDVALLDQALKGLGFESVTIHDAGLGALTRAVNAYARRLQAAGPSAVGFFYYSGHGASDGSTNYLIPVDVKTIEAGELWDQSLRLTEITRKLKAEAGNATHFVVFDACRNTLKLTQPGSRALVQSKGFVPVAQENGMLIAYATAEGELASDVGTSAGPYAQALAEEIVKPGIEAVVMFRAVQRRVRAAIRQEPYLGFNALGDVYLAGRSEQAVQPKQPGEYSRAEVAQFCQSVATNPSIAVLQSLLDAYKGTLLAGCVQARLEELRKQQVAIASPPSQPPQPKPPRPAAAITPSHCDGVEITVGQGERRCFKPGAGKVEHFQDCPTCPEMVVVPSGSFTMGSPANEPERSGGEEQVRVSIAAPLAVGRFAVTFNEWEACVFDAGCNGFPSDNGWRRLDRPVINVNWDDAKIYATWLSRKTGKTYRLLSEAEREYVTRAGTTTPFCWGSSITPMQANYNGSLEPYTGGGSKGENRQRTVPVDSFAPNPWGLYNVHGNVLEWTEDCRNDRNLGNPGDGSARTTGKCDERIARGGSYAVYPALLRSASRITQFAKASFDQYGFRVARSLAR
jgi:formylglycine-generating enzyme required for sulfatase activity